jgi:serine/threonine protein kinase
MGAPKVKAGTVIAGRYRLVAPLSRGGMGSVWRAEHLSLGSPIAIKLIDASLVEHTEARARFEREARAAAALRSPHVVQILDHGVDKDLPFMAMELLEGESLAGRLHRVRILPVAQTVSILRDVSRAMRKAHEAGIIHRDLKPDNIFLVRNDDLEIAKVLDFGIAKSPEPFGDWSGGTRTGALIGTPQYMSPEQAQGHAIDHTTDLWALGVIAFECVCGRLPFPSEKPGELILQICAHPMPIPSRVARVLPGFDAWFARACNRDPKRRYGTAKELTDTLTEALGMSPDVTGPMQAPQRAQTVPNPPVAAALMAPAAPPALPPPAAPPARPAPGSVEALPRLAAFDMTPTEVAPHPVPPQAPPGVGPGGTWLPHGPLPAAGSPPQHVPLPAAGSPPQPLAPSVAESVSSNIPTPIRLSPPAVAPLPAAAPPPASGPFPAAVPSSGSGPFPAVVPSPGDDSAYSGPRADRDPTTLMAPRLGGTMNGGAVMDSDPATFVAMTGARSKRIKVVVAAAAAVLVGLVLVLVLSGDPGGAPTSGDTVAPAVSPAVTPSVAVTPAEPPATARPEPSGTATAAGSTASSGSSGSSAPGPAGGVKTGPKGTGTGKAATPQPSGSASVNPLIGW